MEQIAMPQTNTNDPDRVLAQSVAGRCGWQTNGAGAVFDDQGVILANSLDELGRIMRGLAWFTPEAAKVTGVNWRAIPDDRVDVSQAVRAAARKL